MWRKYGVIGIVIIVVGSFILLQFFSKKEEETSMIVDQQDNVFAQNEKETTVEAEEPLILLVDIKGAIKHPGLYKINEGDRIQDVIDLAGGLTEDADENQINLAQRLQDEMVIYIPTIGEEIEHTQPNISSTNTQHAQDGKIAINHATVEEIQTLNGIGPKKAETIIAHREENGPFQTIEDLLNVSGIGEKTLENIRDQISVP
ncbi:helix-hairpin-helix domain-containing protein [Pseudogracilibacillus sp. ICA-222130]|uniref:helix-hairpin-helix domain-containing protein n=1 Tax=Pseudogracilibacillus sp. ICA-222130 TaxID=3134655 RepID=UPI0030BD1349